ncbi:PQ-loop repeat-containing protein [Candidatus Woesearchaeota archaeon]|jgi:MtN3 and saliva related transmembrane protein|nr:PQ-loop repeat-containing protein [Candidatus Woesearchaeota archaeon]MBT5396834.1 PQ-loop repeat-containing protein [Candidatus Woesearchaeota archaeon]MBT5924148.1 PQ-loop repeat-containing protein [Candidatus Woesearchaeota archaeon]MBT6367722.1 PQ-loop repeat-containing protein [Candidatus Woesearchaeota archaeon]MBT7762877.1 PQ-loop repeat-containing protein [Candidatus Woesearchaeota archaeon]
MDFTQVLGWIATILFSIMLIPQIVKTIKVKDTKGVSLLLFVTYLIANVIALIYAYLITQPPLIFKYLLGIITAEIYIIIFLLYYKRKE